MDNNDSELAQRKWPCTYCTYRNWASSTKCTMCKVPRPLQLIEDVAAACGGGNSTIPVPLLVQCENADRWTCTTCTYVNWLRSMRCVQCLTPKSAIENTNTCVENLSPSTSIVQQEDQNPGTSTQLDSAIVARKLQKWKCDVCTYENWPKASKCIMCQSIRGDVMSRCSSSGTTTSPRCESGNQSPNGSSRDKKRGGSSQDQCCEGTGRKSPKSSTGSSNESLAVASATIISSSSSHVDNSSSDALETHLRRLRQHPSRLLDFLWLNAIRSTISSSHMGDVEAIEAYLASGGDCSRQLNLAEVQLLERSYSCTFETGQTLLMLALRFQRDDVAALVFSRSDVKIATGRRIKRVPCHVSPDTACNIRRSVAMCLRQRKGELPCVYMTELTTFALPSSIYDLSPSIQQRLFDELLDRGVQKELEEESAIINWSLEITDRLGSRLYALWNRTAGDCLLDSVLQATWGVFDSDNSLRQALSDSLADAAQAFYPRWREYESMLAKAMHYSLDEEQFSRDWDYSLKLASKPGSALEQTHVFALAHIVRRPIIVYAVRIVKSYRGEHLDYARFEGVYVPFLWEPTFCSRSPICLGYTRGHFVALAPMEPSRFRSGSIREQRYAHLPLQDSDGKLLPIRFIVQNELGHEQSILRTWLDVIVTDGGLWCAKMKLHTQPALVEQMIEDWLDYYRRQQAHQQIGMQRQQQQQQQTPPRFGRQLSPTVAVSSPAFPNNNAGGMTSGELPPTVVSAATTIVDILSSSTTVAATATDRQVDIVAEKSGTQSANKQSNTEKHPDNDEEVDERGGDWSTSDESADEE